MALGAGRAFSIPPFGAPGPWYVAPVSDASPILVTGANGHLGQALLCTLALAGRPAHAVVRSERAADQVRGLPEPPGIHVLDYADEDALCRAGEG